MELPNALGDRLNWHRLISSDVMSRIAVPGLSLRQPRGRGCRKLTVLTDRAGGYLKLNRTKCRKTGLTALLGIILIGGSVLVGSAIGSPQTPSPANSVKSVRHGVYTREQANRGESIYYQECANCHGATLRGGEAPGLLGDSFLSNYSGMSLFTLVDRVRKTMPADSPGRLTRQQYSDIVALLLRENSLPNGETELPMDTEALERITFDPQSAALPKQ